MLIQVSLMVIFEFFSLRGPRPPIDVMQTNRAPISNIFQIFSKAVPIMKLVILQPILFRFLLSEFWVQDYSTYTPWIKNLRGFGQIKMKNFGLKPTERLIKKPPLKLKTINQSTFLSKFQAIKGCAKNPNPCLFWVPLYKFHSALKKHCKKQDKSRLKF